MVILLGWVFQKQETLFLMSEVPQYSSQFVRCTIREEYPPWIFLPSCASLTSLRYSERACQTSALSGSIPSPCRTPRGLLPAWHLPSRKKIVQNPAQSVLCEHTGKQWCAALTCPRAAGAVACCSSRRHRRQLLWGVRGAGCAAPSPRTAQGGGQTA